MHGFEEWESLYLANVIRRMRIQAAVLLVLFVAIHNAWHAVAYHEGRNDGSDLC